ncbi:NAD(P)H-hydrate dehydratase [bacterium]|jgi:NAD(P)H-hydrate epimerase|nr:NAD(P)H-hydrate dehydratase [bacterium]
MKAVTPQEIKEMDARASSEFGVAETILMENAGKTVAETVKKEVSSMSETPQVVVLCGKGNNGGDGLVAARHLCSVFPDVKILCCFKEEDAGNNTKEQLKKIKKSSVDFLPDSLEKYLGKDCIVVDALLGIGVRGKVESPCSDWINTVNRSGHFVVSVDVPSGLDALSGLPCGTSVKADVTVTMGLPKIGLLYEKASAYTGKMIVADIGYPDEIYNMSHSRVEVMTPSEAKSFIPKRFCPSDKRSYGHVFIVSGSSLYTGAGIMCARASMRAGAGLVTLGVPESLLSVYQSRLIEEMPFPLKEKSHGILGFKALPQILNWTQRADAAVIGPGLSVDSETMALVRDVIKYSTGKIVLDADAITAVSENADVLNFSGAETVLTPHAGEMARLCGCTREEVEANRWELALEVAEKRNTTVVLKGARTVIAGKNGSLFVNITGNPGMATGGSGDALAGIIGSLIAQGLGSFNASVFGVFLHGVAGDIAASKKGEISLIASDIISSIPDAYNMLPSL